LLYFILAFALWMLVFGDDSGTFGYYALAIAIPLALVLSSVFLHFAIRRPFDSQSLAGVIVASIVIEALLIISIPGPL
jgi:hypothetical protein